MHRLETLRDNRPGIENGLDEVVAGELAARRSEIGPLLDRIGLDGVTRHAALAGEQLLPERRVAPAVHGGGHDLRRVHFGNALPGRDALGDRHLPGPLRRGDQLVVVAVDGGLDLHPVTRQPEVRQGEEEADFPRVAPRQLLGVLTVALLDQGAVGEGPKAFFKSMTSVLWP